MKNTKTAPAQKARGSRKPQADTPLRKLSKKRIWMFRLILIFLVPAFILGVFELALKAAGYGYPTSFFIKSVIGDKDFLIPNYQFSHRFFPPKLARTPVPFRMPAEKSAGTYRIFVFGESAALGVPDASYGFSRHLEVLLQQRYPGTEFEVVCTAMTAINSHSILPVARECSSLDGDLWVVYMGNNEMVGPFGAGTIFGGKAPALALVRTGLALKNTRLGQFMASLAAKPGSKSDMPTHWTGIGMFRKNLLRHDDRGKRRAYINFEGNLNDILKSGKKAGVPVILSTVGSNLKDCSPFASLHREDLDTSSKSQWDRLFKEGMRLEKTGQYEAALTQYSQAAAIDSEYAELHFRMGTCQLALGRSGPARQAFAMARDYDALAVRADSRINRIVMDAARKADGQVIGVDAEEALAAQAARGIPGQDFFYEHVHLTVEGNFALARIIADQVRTLLPAGILESETANWLEYEDCSRYLALTAWDELRLWQDEAKRLGMVPFISQTSNPHNRKYINRKIRILKGRMSDSSAAQDRKLYEAAIERSPEDPFLRDNYSDFLNASGNLPAAIEQAEKYRDLLPDFAWPHCWLGALLMENGQLREARRSLERALEVRSDNEPARELLKRL
jgi:tetratricopeptide (TPR) repeat protein